VTDAQGKPLQKGSGEMVLQRPDHFRWEAKQPDDNLILSDGKAVWLYDPFVEQVTVMSLSKAVVNTPFLLISSTDDKIWKNYLIDQDGSASPSPVSKKISVSNHCAWCLMIKTILPGWK
jgi:Outer membrane lipoprotein-sorting protein